MRRFEPVAGLGGLLLLVSLFLPWYSGTPVIAQSDVTLIGVEQTRTAWQAFAVIDVLLALFALLAIAVPVVSVASSGPAKPIAAEVIASAFGWIAVLLVAFRLLELPDGFRELRYGAWLALAGAVIAWIGSWMSMRDESTPGALPPDVPRRPAPPAAAA
jgi:hypothetical protein